MSANIRSKIYIIVSMTLFGTISIFVRNINLSSGEIALYRAILAFSVISCFLFITKKFLGFKELKKNLLYLALSGGFMGFNWILLFEAYNYTSVSVATLAYYFSPLIVVMVSSFIFKEKLTKKNSICFIFSSIGIILLSGVIGNKNEGSHLIGFSLGLGAAVLYATVVLLNKGMKEVDGINRTCYQFLFAIIVLIPYVSLSSGFNITKINLDSWINLLIIGIVHTGIIYCLYFISLKELSGQEIGIFSYIDPMVAVLVSVLVFEESMNIYQIIGTILIFVFAIINEIRFNKFKIEK